MSPRTRWPWPSWIAWILLALVFAPTISLIAQALTATPRAFWAELWSSRVFLGAAQRTASQVAAVFLLTWLLGWPLGNALGLWRFAGRRWAMAIMVLPLLTPPFLWAIGIQGWKPFFNFETQAWFDGFRGSVLAYTIQAVPLLAIIVAASHRLLGRSEREAVLLAGGPRLLFWCCMSHTWPLAGAGAALAATMTLSDAGGGLIMGWHGLATEVHIALAARGDAVGASAKAIAVAGMVSPIALAAALIFAREVGSKATLHDVSLTAGAKDMRIPASLPGAMIIWIGAVMMPLAGFLGLIRPLFSSGGWQFFPSAGTVLLESARATGEIAAGAAFSALGIGLFIALILNGRRWLMHLLIILALLSLTLPPALPALGILNWRIGLPAALDFATQSEWWVGAVCGLRWVPAVAFLLALDWRQLPASVRESALVCGVPRFYLFTRLVVPALWSRVVVLAIIVALISMSDVSTALLLQPPGEASYGMRLFSVMDNAPDKHVATLCLVYLAWPLSLGAMAELVRLAKSIGNPTCR